MSEPISKKILVVDDEKEVLVHLVHTLERVNFEVTSASKGREAVALAKELRPDLIVLDVALPDMDGRDVASALSEEPSTAKIPIVFLTGVITEEREMAKITEKYPVMVKPVTGEELLGAISSALAG